MTNTVFSGVITPLITPFNRKLEVDIDSLKWLVTYQLEHRIDGVFPNSTTGEFVHLKPREAELVVKTVLEVASSRLKVVAGISTNTLIHTLELGRLFVDMGVDGVVITTPYYFKYNTPTLKKYFSEIANNLDTYIIVYNIPKTTGITIPVELYEQLVSEHSNIVAAKVTTSDFTYIRRLIQSTKSIRRDFSVLVGLDELLLPVLIAGGDGGIMGLANITPWLHKSIYSSWIERNWAEAHKLWLKLLKLSKIYDVSSSPPSAVKTALKILRAPIEPYVRPPLQLEPPSVEEEIRSILVELGIREIT